jgi:hypothetical protein
VREDIDGLVEHNNNNAIWQEKDKNVVRQTMHCFSIKTL